MDFSNYFRILNEATKDMDPEVKEINQLYMNLLSGLIHNIPKETIFKQKSDGRMYLHINRDIPHYPLGIGLPSEFWDLYEDIPNDEVKPNCIWLEGGFDLKNLGLTMYELIDLYLTDFSKMTKEELKELMGISYHEMFGNKEVSKASVIATLMACTSVNMPMEDIWKSEKMSGECKSFWRTPIPYDEYFLYGTTMPTFYADVMTGAIAKAVYCFDYKYYPLFKGTIKNPDDFIEDGIFRIICPEKDIHCDDTMLAISEFSFPCHSATCLMGRDEAFPFKKDPKWD